MDHHDPQLTQLLLDACQQGISSGQLHGMVVAAGRGPVPDLIWAGGDAAVEPMRRPMSTDAIFDVASVTKVMATATACGICIDRGRLDPDAPVHQYLPDCAQPPGPELRVRDLATHTSGFANEKFVGLPGEAVMQQMLTAPGQWPPGERFHYACRNFILLGLIVESIVGQNLDAFCRDAIYNPLGMASTVGYPPPPSLRDRMVPGIIHAGPDQHSVFVRAGRMLGHAGLYSCAGDIARFCAMMLNEGIAGDTRILGEAALNWLTKPCSPPGLPVRSFGYEMRYASAPGSVEELPHETRPDSPHRPLGLSKAAYGHGGWTGQSVWIDPQPGFYVIVLTNRTHCLDFMANRYSGQRLRQRVGDILLAFRRTFSPTEC